MPKWSRYRVSAAKRIFFPAREAAPIDGADTTLDTSEELERAAAVFHTMSLVQLRRSHSAICQLDQSVIERFVEKYSDFIIFLLSVSDRTRARELLDRLTDHSLIYIAEEELRGALIGEIAAAARDGRDFLDFSLFLDLVDRPPAAGPLPDCVAHVLQMAATGGGAARPLAALESVPPLRRSAALSGILQRNRAVALGLVAYASRNLRCAAMDALLEKSPDLLALIPASRFFERFTEEHSAYLPIALRHHLPDEVQRTLQQFEEFFRQQASSLEEIRRLAAETPSAERRSRLLDLIYSLQLKLQGPAADLVMQEFLKLGALDEADLDLLRRLRQSR
ncbi:MAG: hypothetical protein K1X75_04155 [Leptospirales bacterium]|nr:hypothetical protein [Leptospirales bacterium]